MQESNNVIEFKPRDKKPENKCIYMVHDKEHFEGEKYCGFFNKYCDDIRFICPSNCQVNYLETQVKKYQEVYNKVFGDDIPSDDVNFCDVCCAKDKCNGCCCYEQIKEMFEAVQNEQG